MMAAIIIFSVGVLAVLDALTASLRSAETARAYTTAVYLGRQVIEETLAEGEFQAGDDTGGFGPAWPGYAWHQVMEETDRTGLYTLSVSVTWTERGREREWRAVTLAAERSAQ
jgi:Tfp pilus assembly protein PilV